MVVTIKNLSIHKSKNQRVILMKEGDFVRIDYVGRIKGSGEIFDLTKEDVARKNGIYNPNMNYKPVPIIIGARMVIKGLEDALKKMKVGERKKIVVEPEDGFGKRNEKLIKLLPLSEFQRKDIIPQPGMWITVNNLRGKVLSVSGGRVKVDFNHPLAGKRLEYDVEIKEKITDTKEKIKSIFEFFLGKEPNLKVTIKRKKAIIKIKEDIPRQAKLFISQIIKRWVKPIENIKFVEEF